MSANIEQIKAILERAGKTDLLQKQKVNLDKERLQLEATVSLEEEISHTYHDGSITDTEDIDHVAYENIARHFAKWGAEHTPLPEDTVLFQKGVEEGKRLMREEAVEGYVNYYEDSGGILMAEAQVGCPYHNGDKVRIIVLPKEEK